MLLGASAQGAVYTIEATATVAQSNRFDAPIGTPIAVALTYDADAEPIPGNDGQTLRFYDGIETRITVGSAAEVVCEGLPILRIYNDFDSHGPPAHDGLVTTTYECAGVLGEVEVRTDIGLADYTTTAFDSTALPTKLSLEDFAPASNIYVYIGHFPTTQSVGGPIDTLVLVPEPSALLATLVAIVALAFLGRKERSDAARQ